MFQDLTGKTYGLLSVLSYAGKNKHGISMWLCRCECGTEKVICSMGMKAGKTTSCGCWRAKILTAGRMQLQSGNDGRSKTREYRLWANIIYRCCTQSCQQFDDYGGRGITVCKRWRESFKAFLEDMGTAPTPKHTIDRKDNDGPYSKKNCRWATRKEQANNRRGCRMLEYKGETKTMSAWASEFGINVHTIMSRLRMGWTVAKALEAPVDSRKATKRCRQSRPTSSKSGSPARRA